MRSDAWRSSKAATSPLRFNLLRTCAAFVVVFLAPCGFFWKYRSNFVPKQAQFWRILSHMLRVHFLVRFPVMFEHFWFPLPLCDLRAIFV